MYGTGKNDIQAKVWYLTAVKHYQLYGYQLFHVSFKGFWSHPSNILLAVGVGGVKFVNQKTKQVCVGGGGGRGRWLPLVA